MPSRRWLVVMVWLLSACRVTVPDGSPASRSPPSTPASPTPHATAPAPASPYVVAVKGDWGAGTAAQREVTARMCEVDAQVPFAEVLTTGDNFYTPDGTATASNYFGPERCLIDRPGHAWRAAWGNHDLAGNSTADLLGAADRFYRWSVPGADFFVLDSNRPADEAQRRWLEEGLAASTAPVKIAAFHHPPYTSGSGHPDDPGVRAHWVPLFERFGVTLVLSGHQHVYEHLAASGVHYVVTGGGGGPLYRCAGGEPVLIRCVAAHHFLLLEVGEGSVMVRAIGSDGSEIDRSLAVSPPPGR